MEGRMDGFRESHLRDVGWVAKSYQVAEERGSTTENQVQGHQPDDTWRHEKRSGSGGTRGTQAWQPPTPPQGLACSRQALEKNIPSEGWACALVGFCLPSGNTEQPPNFVPFLLPFLHHGLPPSCTPARESHSTDSPQRPRFPCTPAALSFAEETPLRGAELHPGSGWTGDLCHCARATSRWGPPAAGRPAHCPGDTAITDTSAPALP